jgi:hypothetical protein
VRSPATSSRRNTSVNSADWHSRHLTTQRIPFIGLINSLWGPTALARYRLDRLGDRKLEVKLQAYVLTGLFFLVWLLQSTALAGRPVNRLAVGLAIGLGTLALVISAALPIVSPCFASRVQAGPTRLAR